MTQRYVRSPKRRYHGDTGRLEILAPKHDNRFEVGESSRAKRVDLDLIGGVEGRDPESLPVGESFREAARILANELRIDLIFPNDQQRAIWNRPKPHTWNSIADHSRNVRSSWDTETAARTSLPRATSVTIRAPGPVTIAPVRF